MRVTSKGQVTIPRDLRDLAGIQPNTDVVFSFENGRVVITPKLGASDEAERVRMARILAALDALGGTGDPHVDADALARITRERGDDDAH
ncbi:looped-hinge helix DNA binding domain-containing protein, AbrB family [Rhizobium sp. RU20A]|uniref:AbrB/MazE/SpoVT family DNA-binding domain-containing protein n=1 Tax=Rhizobium sp. RU20A TaxID=1907412 RepID=UPI0009558A4E|nr:AbrB/MazE/SpoVT family DNA-binding domain-containing protein [Rhizobium sp. RU20A]SIQ38040.1 looped-hinge helix DNA binding domain-containing protein, AbrB family [Rhizobium sp. RU20A]